MFCPNCGSEIPEGARFCEECGTPVQTDDEDKNAQADRTEILDDSPMKKQEREKNEGLSPEEERLLRSQGVIGAASGNNRDIEPPEERRMSGIAGWIRLRWKYAVIILALAALSVTGGFLAANALFSDEAEDGASADKGNSVAEENASESTKKTTAKEKSAPAGAQHIIAGRGTEYAGESLSDFAGWVGEGVRMIEQDVSMSSDGVLFVCYDDDRAAVESEPAAYAEARHEKLEDVFRYFREEADVTLVVELKSLSAQATEAFCRLVNDYGYENRVIVQCFDPLVLERVHRVIPEMKTMYLINGRKIESYLSIEDAVDSDYIDVIAVEDEAGLMTEENCSLVHNGGKEFGAFVLKDRSQVSRAISLDVDYYFLGKGEITIAEALRMEEDRD